MPGFTVTIASDDPAGTSATVRLRIGPGGPVVEEISVRIGADGAALPGTLADIDFSSLCEALAVMSEGRLSRPSAAPATTSPVLLSVMTAS